MCVGLIQQQMLVILSVVRECLEDEEASMTQRQSALTTLFYALLYLFSTFNLGGKKKVLTKTTWCHHWSATGHSPHVVRCDDQHLLNTDLLLYLTVLPP